MPTDAPYHVPFVRVSVSLSLQKTPFTFAYTLTIIHLPVISPVSSDLNSVYYVQGAAVYVLQQGVPLEPDLWHRRRDHVVDLDLEAHAAPSTPYITRSCPQHALFTITNDALVAHGFRLGACAAGLHFGFTSPCYYLTSGMLLAVRSSRTSKAVAQGRTVCVDPRLCPS